MWVSRRSWIQSKMHLNVFSLLQCSQVPACGTGILSQTRSPAQALFLWVAKNRSLENKRAGGVYSSTSPLHLLYLQAPVAADFAEAEAASLYVAAFGWLIFLESIQFILLTHLFLSSTVSCAKTSSSIVSVHMATYLLDCFDLSISSYSL